MYQRQGKYAFAEAKVAQALAGRRHGLGSDHPDTKASAADLALAYQSQGKFAESEPLASEAMEIDRKNQPDDWQRFRAESLLGASLAGQKKYAEAEPLLLEGYQGMLARKDRIDVPDWYRWIAPANGLSNFIRRGENRKSCRVEQEVRSTRATCGGAFFSPRALTTTGEAREQPRRETL